MVRRQSRRPPCVLQRPGRHHVVATSGFSLHVPSRRAHQCRDVSGEPEVPLGPSALRSATLAAVSPPKELRSSARHQRPSAWTGRCVGMHVGTALATRTRSLVSPPTWPEWSSSNPVRSHCSCRAFALHQPRIGDGLKGRAV